MPELKPNQHGSTTKDIKYCNTTMTLQNFPLSEEENFLEDDQSHLEGIIPSTFVINYHKDTFPHPLNSVKEDVEAEEAEEETSGNFHSLDYLGISMGPSSLSSSVISSVSLEEGGFINSSDRLNLNKHQMHGSFCPNHPYGGPYGASYSKFKSQLSSTNGKLSPASQSRNSPNPFKSFSPNSFIKEESTLNRPSCCCKNVLQKSQLEKSKVSSEKRAPIWHNPSKSDKLVVTNKKDNSFLKRYGFCRAKSEAKESATASENKFSSLPRKKKEKNEKDVAAETYGTLGRNRKKKEVEQTPKSNINERHARDIPQESKNILDKYATLPRKKAKELSGRWREQFNQKEKDKDYRPPLQRSKSTGKESSRSVRASPSPSLSSASNSTVNSPRNLSSSKQTPKLNLKILSPSARLLARQSYGTGKDKNNEKSPSPSCMASNKQPKLTRCTKKNVHVQVNFQWDPNENYFEEKLIKLEEEHSLLQNRLRNAEANAEEVEQMRMEAVDLRRQAENERLEKEELQDELERTSGKVREMLASMEGVEKEFNNRGESLIEMETQLQTSAELNIKIQEKVNHYEEYGLKLKKDLDKSLAAQKILLQQVQDLEAESREMVDFMAEEKNSLSECLKEAELELCRQRREIGNLKTKVQQKDEEAIQMLRLAEERRIGYLSLQTELESVQSSAEDMMVNQGAQVSGASVALTNLSSRLQILTSKLIQDYSISENDIENVVTPVESDSSVSSTNGTPDLPKSPIRSVNRSSSPRKPVSFMQSFLNAMRSAQSSSKLLVTYKSTPLKLPEERKSPEGSDQCQQNNKDFVAESSTQQNLSDQVSEVDALLTRFLKVCCVLKSDADNILSELEDENERLCNQIQLQQQMIDQQYSEFESLSNLESNARKELKLITKDLEFANATLNKVCDDDTKARVKNVDEALRAINQNLNRMETMHAEKKDKLTQARNKLPLARSRFYSENSVESPKSKAKAVGLQNIRISVCKNQWMEHKNKAENDFLNLNISDELDVPESSDHDVDYIVNHVLKTLETVPDIVSTCPALKNLYLHLTSSDPFEKDVNFNPNSVSSQKLCETQSDIISSDTENTNLHLGLCSNGAVYTDDSNKETCMPRPMSKVDASGTDNFVVSSDVLLNSLPASTPVTELNLSLATTPVTELNLSLVTTPDINLSPATTPVTALNSPPTLHPAINGNLDNHSHNNFTENETNGNTDTSGILIDCNANPEITDSSHQTEDLLSNLADPLKFIPRLTNETSL